MDKHKDFGIRLEKSNLVEFSAEVMRMAENDSELLNTVYKEVSEKLGMDTAMEIYQMFKGQQINFPVRFFNPVRIQQIIVKEYDGITTSHLIHPDNWMPYAPSGITRNEIAIWQYGKNCHPIEDDTGIVVTFNLDLVRNEQVIIDKMF